MIKKDVVTIKDRVTTKKLNSERQVVYTEEWIEAQKRPMSRFTKKRNTSKLANLGSESPTKDPI